MLYECAAVIESEQITGPELARWWRWTRKGEGQTWEPQVRQLLATVEENEFPPALLGEAFRQWGDAWETEEAKSSPDAPGGTLDGPHELAARLRSLLENAPDAPQSTPEGPHEV